MWKIETCCCCLELLQFVSSCYSGNNRLCCLYLMVEVLSVGWLLTSWVSVWCLCLHLVRVYIYVCNFLFTSNTEADVPELFLVVHSTSTKMTKYGSLSSFLHFHRVFLLVWIALSTNLFLWGNSWLEVLCMKSHDLEKFLKFTPAILVSIVTKYYFG